MVCPKRVLNFSSSVSCNSPKIPVVFFGNGERSKDFHGPYLLNVSPLIPFVRREWKALPRPNIINSRVFFKLIRTVNRMFNPYITEKLSPPLPEMTSINNSSAAKFLALFCIPALLLASGSFDVASSVIV